MPGEKGVLVSGCRGLADLRWLALAADTVVRKGADEPAEAVPDY
ncbi:hypothetical protein [Amycolatopsis minnesotensis]